MSMTGSFQNRLAERAVKGQPIPEVGMGITLLYHSDRHAGTIRKVSENKKKFWFTMDEATRSDKNGMSDAQSYTYRTQTEILEPDWHLATLRNDGRWHDGTTKHGTCIALGYRSEYYDFSF